MKSNLKAATVQFQHSPGDLRANMAKVTAFSEAAAHLGAQVVVFPEMCLTGYWHVRNLSRAEVEALSEPVPDGPLTRELLALSRRLNITIGAGLIERTLDDRMFNSYVVAMPDGRFANHRKIHTFISAHLTSGDAYTVFDLPGGWRAGVLTCYDNNIVENVRATALLGAEVILAPHQTGGCRSRSPRAMGAIDPRLWDERESNPSAIEAEFTGQKGRAWLMRWLPSRAHDNGLYYLFSNGVGTDDDEVRTGNAMILDPYGEIIAESRKAADDMVTAELDHSVIATSSGRRWLTARRPELYGLLTRPTGQEQHVRKVRMGEG